MKKIYSLFLIASLTILGCTTIDWEKFKKPTPEEQQPIGYYSAGCLSGGEGLALESNHYVVMNRHRNRYYGHQFLLEYVENLSRSIHNEGLGLQMIGDLGLPRGGPMLTGHASHQVGLDVDIWFRRLSKEEAKKATVESLKEMKLVYLAKDDEMTEHWGPDYAKVLKMAATPPRVQRIFINPRIKKELCKNHKGEPWMSKLRPWWGHDEHFHVRLYCPPGAKNCRTQTPVPEGDGCDANLEWWFTAEAKEEAVKRFGGKRSMPKLPDLCKSVAKFAVPGDES